MSGIDKSDLLFMITSVVVLLIGAFLLILIVYIIQILRDIRRITHAGEEIVDDLHEFRMQIKDGGFRKLKWFKFLKTVISKRVRKHKSRS